MSARNHGSCRHQNKYPVRDNEYNYHDSLRAPIMEEIGRSLELIHRLYVTPRVP